MAKREVSEENIYRFTQPLFGFEEYTDFAVLNDKELGEDVAWLQSVQNAGLCFIMMDPNKLLPNYLPVLPVGSDRLLGEGDCFCWAIAVIPPNFKDATVNLKSPIFLNPNNHPCGSDNDRRRIPCSFFPVERGAKPMLVISRKQDDSDHY